MPKSKARVKNRKSSVSFVEKITSARPLVVVAVLSILLLVVLANVQTTQVLTANSQQGVLGDDENDSNDQEDQDENKSGGNKEDEKKNEEIKKQKEQQEKKQESQSSKIFKSKSILISPKPSKPVVSPDLEEDEDEDIEDDLVESEEETEIKTADGQKIKTKIKNGVTTKIEIEYGELKLKYKLENGKLVLKAEDESGEELDLDEDELNELEDEAESELEEEGIDIEQVDDDTVGLTRNNVSALTSFPLSIDIGTNSLILTTPQGQRIVTVLPDQAVKNLLAAGIVTTVAGISTEAQVVGPSLSSDALKLELRDRDIVYRIKGIKKHKVFGFIPVNSSTTAFVSANSGSVVAQERSALTNLVDLLSF